MKRVYSYEELLAQLEAARAAKNLAFTLFESIKRERDTLKREIATLENLIKELREKKRD